MTTSMKSFRRAWTAGWFGAAALAVVGHFVEHKPWSVLLADYDITSGRIWLLIPIWVAIGPTVVRRLRVSRTESAEFHHQTAKG